MFHNEGNLYGKKNGFVRSQHIKFWARFPKKIFFYSFLFLFFDSMYGSTYGSEIAKYSMRLSTSVGSFPKVSEQ